MRTLPLFAPLFGERSLTTVAGLYENAGAAYRAADALRAVRRPPRIDLIPPGDPDLGRKLEPESRGIWRTALRAHFWLGLAFVLVGALAGIGLVASGWGAAAASPLFTVFFCAVLGGFVGLLFGGLLTLRPDRGALIAKVREASDAGRWAVVAHPVNPMQEQVAREQLGSQDGIVVSSL